MGHQTKVRELLEKEKKDETENESGCEGTEGQDRKNYTDYQDRKNYTIKEE